MSALDSIIDKINADSDKGKMFENLCLYFLKNDRLQQERFSHVWHWDEWPGNNGEPDTGIDIVAQFRDSESYCAVQCKLRQNDSSISKQEIDSFLALSSKKEFSERIIFALTDDFNRHAENTLKGQSPDVKIFTRETLESSNIDWDSFKFDKPEIVSHKAKEFRKYQEDAINDVLNGLASHDRGKLIMACGTGKTFTSMKIAEKFAGKGGVVLVLVPSISLMNQTIIAWNNDHDENLHLIQFAVCSDSTVGKKTYPDEDMKPENLALDATTNVKDLITEWEKQTRKSESMTVIFSTYQSLKVIHDAQQTENGFPVFDLVICDEAHRTAGVSQNARMIQNEFDANFQAVHDDSFIHARKRLYMTATPKVFGDTPERKAAIKKKAEEHNAVLYSMDDENIYGPEFHRLSFSKAVEAKLLADYKVMVFMVKEGESKELTNAAKLDGIRTALAKDIQQEDYDFIATDPKPMKRAVNFTSTIIESRDVFKPHIPGTVTTTPIDGSQSPAEISFKAQHIDGTQSASERSRVIRWLKDDPAPGECRILSNARCLSEGVDVPALDAVIFFSPKRSQIDIVQSVGRVMRKAEGKNFGYVILPVAIKPGEIPETALDNNKEYQAVWEVLQALRSHDDNFNATINSLDFNGKSDKVRVIGHPRLTEYFTPEEIDAWKQAVYVRMVRKCGDREYWDKWVSDLAAVADSHTQSLQSALEIPGAKIAFNDFADDLRHTINPSISNDDAVSMLAQHIVSKRVFDELFTEFSHLNPVSQALQRIISRLASFGFKADDSRLEKFYADVRSKVSAVKTDTGKQEVIRQIYDSFFRIAFPKMAQKLGIVYTPVAIVDFILKSSDWAVRNILNIDEGLASYNVQILDPFSGTGTFTARLIQSGIIKRGRLTWKYNNGQIFANEILLLPYYISAVNIEAAFTQINDGEYSEFPGMVLADTFMLDPLAQQQVLHPIFRENGERAHKETQSDVNIIIGNPPYSVGQKNANDNNQNTIYPALRGLVKSSYAKESTATNKNSLYDSYILAFKWASERLKGSRGVICFVTNGSFIDSNSADGMRKCLAEDFAYIYIFNLRGNANTSGELRRKEAGNVFGDGTKTPVAVTMLVKDESRKGKPCEIYYYEVGDYMKRDEKLAELERLGDFGKMISAGLMRRIRPNDAGDWVTQRAEIYSEFVNLGNKKEDRPAIFGERYSRGVITERDAWCCNFSRESLCANMAGMIEVYNSERERWNQHGDGRIEGFVTNDKHKISWSRALYRCIKNDVQLQFSEESVRVSLHRPYVKEYLYFDPSRRLNEEVYQMPAIFPEHDTKNLLICVMGIGAKKDFSVLMTDCLPELQVIMNGQCFPLYWYTRGEQMTLFESGLVRHDGISDTALVEFRTRYADVAITKRDIFSYIYGVLSSREYALRFGNEAKKVLARVPYVKDAETFREFSEAGRKLGELHVNYESADEWPLTVENDGGRITKLKANVKDGEITGPGVRVTGIPESAWEYKVNGRSALEWIVERYRDDTDKDSGIRNDCNEWGGAEYVMSLIRRVVTVSVETVRILEGLPELGV